MIIQNFLLAVFHEKIIDAGHLDAAGYGARQKTSCSAGSRVVCKVTIFPAAIACCPEMDPGIITNLDGAF